MQKGTFGVRVQPSSNLHLECQKNLGASSEDIDLSFDRSDLGYSGSRDPTRVGISRRKADQLVEDLMREVQTHIGEKFLPTLRAARCDRGAAW